MSEEIEMPMKNRPHPGELIRTEVIEDLSLSVSKATAILKVRRTTLSDLLRGKAALTPKWLCASKSHSVQTWTTYSVFS
jgi:addiction module HigA family antidote